MATLCIFTSHGHTYTFKQTELVVSNEDVLVYKYTAMSDGKDKMVTVLKKNIVAYSVAA